MIDETDNPVDSGRDNAQNRTFSRAEKAILSVLVNPDFYAKTNVEKIEASGVSPRRFYEILADPEFKAQERAAFHDMIRSRIGPIIDAAVKTASAEGRDGFQDRRMLLEMAGMYTPKKGVDLTSGGLPLKTYQDINDGEPVPAFPAAGVVIDPIDDGDGPTAERTDDASN